MQRENYNGEGRRVWWLETSAARQQLSENVRCNID